MRAAKGRETVRKRNLGSEAKEGGQSPCRQYDDSKAGVYFVTICTRSRQCLFGDMVDGTMRLNEWGKIVQECWDAIPAHFPNVPVDTFVVMPNHVHGM